MSSRGWRAHSRWRWRLRCPPISRVGWGGRNYPALFAEAFGTPGITARRIALAIATYERTLASNRAPIDSPKANPPALNPQEAAGRVLFTTLPCGVCHGGPLLTDQQFHYIGVRPVAEDSGRAIVTGAPADRGSMRTPSLRNVALRTAFMHDGRFSTLEEVVNFYERGGDFNAPSKSPLIAPFVSTPIQKAQLVAFTRRPLTDPRVAAEQAPFHRPSLYSESELVPQVLGTGVVGTGGIVPQPIAYEPPISSNPDFTLGITRGRSGASAVLVVDDADPAVGGGIPASGALAHRTTTLAASGAGAGSGSISFAIPADPTLEGHSFFARWFVSDPAASGERRAGDHPLGAVPRVRGSWGGRALGGWGRVASDAAARVAPVRGATESLPSGHVAALRTLRAGRGPVGDPRCGGPRRPSARRGFLPTGGDA